MAVDQVPERNWDDVWRYVEAQSWYPDEQVVRFMARYVSRRVGFKADDVVIAAGQERGLDAGCGKGRHLALMADLGIEAHGIDVSRVGIDFTRVWLESLDLKAEVRVGGMEKLPYENDMFDFAICHGVLDHMFEKPRAAAIKEMARVIRSDGLFFFSVISKEDSAYQESDFVEDDTIIVSDGFEQGMPQAFFDEDRIYREFGDVFTFESITRAVLDTRRGRSLIGSDKDYPKDARFYVLARVI